MLLLVNCYYNTAKYQSMLIECKQNEGQKRIILNFSGVQRSVRG